MQPIKRRSAINMFTKEALNTEMQFAENLQPITDIYRLALLHRGFCNIFLLHSHCLFGIPSDHGCELLGRICPSEQVAAIAMRNCLPEFLVDSSEQSILTKLVLVKTGVHS